MFSGNRLSLRGGNPEIRRLQDALRSAGGRDNGSVSTLLRSVSPDVRRQAISDSRGSDLIFDTALDVVGADRGQDAVYLSEVLRDLNVQPLQPGEAAPSGLQVPKKLVNAAYVLSQQNLRPEFEHGRLPNIATQQLLAGELPYEVFARSFRVPNRLLPELMERGVMTFEQYMHAPGVDAMTLPVFARRELAAGRLDFEHFAARGFRLSPELLGTMLQAGDISPQMYLRIPGADPKRAEDFLLDGVLSFKEALPHLGFLRLADAEMYITTTADSKSPGTWRDWLQNGAIVDEDLQEGVSRGLFTENDIPEAGPNAFALAKELNRVGVLNVTKAAEYVIPLWEPRMPFPQFLKDMIAAYPSHEAVVKQMPLPGPPGTPMNGPFLTRAIAVWTLHHTARPVAAHTARALQPATECKICCSEPDLGSELFKLEDCTSHVANMDLDCFMRGAESNGGWRCPDTDCARPLDPDEVFSIKNDPDAAQACAISRVGDYRAQHTKDWKSCPTDKCPDGASVREGTHVQFDCRCCGKKELFSQPIDGTRLLTPMSVQCGCHPHRPAHVVAQQVHIDMHGLTEAKMMQIEQLCEMWTNPPRNPAQNGTGDRPNVPCFFDSVNLMHGDACQHMTHDTASGGCGHEIHQSDGPYQRSQHNGLYNYGPIRYVPFGQNLLVQYGCFLPYQPGQMEPPGESAERRQYAIANNLRRNVVALRQRFSAHQAEMRVWRGEQARAESSGAGRSRLSVVASSSGGSSSRSVRSSIFRR